MDRLLLIGAMLCFMASFSATLFALRAGRFPGHFNFVSILCGFILLTAFIYLRGKAEGACPLNSLFEVLIFQSWSLILMYLMIGAAYRLSLLGVFTALFALILILLALVIPLNQTVINRQSNPWMEFHAALLIVAYGAFGLACIAGVMYLLQEKQLKAHKISSLLFHLPPINDLAVANGRLLWIGFGLLTVSCTGLASQLPIHSFKFWTSAAIWLAYGTMLFLHHMRTLAPRRLAGLSVAVFALTMLTLPGIQYLSSRP